jgi:protein ImuA
MEVRMGQPTLTDLAQRIRDIEASERPLTQATVPFPPLADALPHGGLPTGSLVELLSTRAGSGAWTLALLMARAICGEQRSLVIADLERAFYPPAAARLGIDLTRTLILRSPRREHAQAALVQSLRCPAVGAVIGGCERLTSAEYRALQLAAQSGGGIGLLLRPASARGVPSFAEIRLLLAPAPSLTRGSIFVRHIRVEVLRARGGRAGGTFLLEIDHETGHVHPLSRLADAALPAHAPGPA